MNPFLRYLADKNSVHTQTDRQTDRQTDTRRWPQDLAAYGAQVTIPNIWNGTIFGDLDLPLNTLRGLSAIAEFLVQ